MRKPNHLGKTLRNAGAGAVVRVETRELTDADRARLDAKKAEQAARLARIAARAKKS